MHAVSAFLQFSMYLSSRSTKVSKTSDSTESSVSVPYRRLDRGRGGPGGRGRDDSLDSGSTSAKSSIQYSDTSSLLSHRFSTVSISSNVSSEISFGNVSGGSSCYLASMSSADFDERPPLASSLSLSEADEIEAAAIAAAAAAAEGNTRSVQERSRLKALFRRGGNKDESPPMGSSAAAAASQTSPKINPSAQAAALLAREDAARHPRSRIGTETSIETSIENPITCLDRSSFEEELFQEMTSEEESKKKHLLSAESSQDSESGGGGDGNFTHHRFYHVFREGELDYLIGKYVDNLHIIASYYDHSNWCVIAEKVNVWTI